MARELTAEQKIERLLDLQQVHNVMSKHAYFHALTKNLEELEAIWAQKAPDPSFAQNFGYYVGMDTLRHVYGELNVTMRQAALDALRAHYPDLADTPENRGAGSLVMHTLTTPIVEIAGDGQTAKGMWYSPGQITDISQEGLPSAFWIWERYGVDFIKEDGDWKIWHMLVCTDFFTPIDKSWTKVNKDAPIGAGEGLLPFERPKPDKEGPTYQAFSPTQVPQDIPRWPEPYYTFSETFSYGV